MKNTYRISDVLIIFFNDWIYRRTTANNFEITQIVGMKLHRVGMNMKKTKVMFSNHILDYEIKVEVEVI